MKTWLTGVALMAAAALAGVVAFCQPMGAAHAAGGRYYVNFDHGDDAADGRSATTAWRHAPGDVNARSRAAETHLQPGDMLLFAPGVRYRGEITLNGGGEPGRPVVITSATGDAPGVIDGSDPVGSVRPCRSSADCGGAEAWSRSSRVDFAEPLAPGAALFTDQGLLFPAQSPEPADMFNSDDVAEYIQASGGDLSRGVAKLPADLARRISGPGDKRILLWTYGNLRVPRDILSVESDQAHFDPTGLKFYTDRPDRIAVVGHPGLVGRPGEYAFIEGGRAAVVFMPPGARVVLAARGRGGVDLNGHSFIEIRDLAFENIADNGVDLRTGIGIGNHRQAGSDILIARNTFRYFRSPLGQGPIILTHMSNLTIVDNKMESVVFGSGMRLGADSNVVVRGNQISRIGRTGIMLMGDNNALVTQNVVSNAKGIHGNGLSAYLGNKNVKFLANSIIDTRSPATFKGDQKNVADNSIVFANNILAGTPDSLYAIASWGSTRNVLIQNNILLGGKVGFLTSKTDEGVTVRHNIVNGMVNRTPPAGWNLADNNDIDFNLASSGKVGARGLQGAIQDAIAGGGAGGWKRLCPLFPPVAGSDPGYQGAIGAKLRCVDESPPAR